MGIAQRASVAALKFGVIFQRSPVGQGLLSPAIGMESIAAAQPTFDLKSFSEVRRVVVEVQLFGAKVATIWIVFWGLLHHSCLYWLMISKGRLYYIIGMAGGGCY